MIWRSSAHRGVSYSDPYGLKAESGGCPPLCDNIDPDKDKFIRTKDPKVAGAAGAVLLLATAAPLVVAEGLPIILGRIGMALSEYGPAAAGAGAGAAGASRLPNAPQFFAIVSKSGQILGRPTANISLSHAEYVQRTIGTLPEGATVVTAFRVANGIQAITSRTIHGVQLPAPQHVINALNAAGR